MRMFKLTTQQVKRNYKKKVTTNYLFFISNNIIARKLILQVTNMRCIVRPIFIFYPQPNRSVDTQNESMNLLVNSFLYFRQSNNAGNTVILAEVVVNRYWEKNSK